MASVGELTAKLTLETKDFDKKLRSSQGGLKNFGTGLTNVGSGVKGLSDKLLGLTAAAGTAAVIFGKGSVDAFKEYQKAMVTLEVIAPRFKVSVEAAQMAAKKLGDELRIGPSAAAEGLQNLLKSGLNLEQAQDLLKRFTNEAMTGKSESISLADAVKNLSFAYTTNNSALGNLSGVSENFEDIIKRGAKLMGKEVGQLSDAEREMAKYRGMIELTNLTKGSAAKFTGTLIDEEAKLGLQINKLQIQIGEKLEPVMMKFYSGVGNFLSENGDELVSFVEDVATGFMEFAQTVKPVVESVVKFAEENPKLVETVLKLAAGLVVLNTSLRVGNFLFGDLIKVGTGAFQMFASSPAAISAAQSAMTGFGTSMKAMFLGPVGIFALIGIAWIALLSKIMSEIEDAEAKARASFDMAGEANRKATEAASKFRGTELGKKSGAITLTGAAAAQRAEAAGKDPAKAARAAELRRAISTAQNLRDQGSVGSGIQTRINNFSKELAGLTKQGYATGLRYVPTDRIAKVHQGEAIIPKSQNPFRGGGGMGGNNITFNINNRGDEKSAYSYMNKLLNIR